MRTHSETALTQRRVGQDCDTEFVGLLDQATVVRMLMQQTVLDLVDGELFWWVRKYKWEPKIAPEYCAWQELHACDASRGQSSWTHQRS